MTDDSCLTVGKGEDGTILGDYGIDEIQISGNPPQVREYSTRCKDDNDAARACLGDGSLDVGR